MTHYGDKYDSINLIRQGDLWGQYLWIKEHGMSPNSLFATGLWEEGRSWMASVATRQQLAPMSIWRATELFRMANQNFSSNLVVVYSWG